MSGRELVCAPQALSEGVRVELPEPEGITPWAEVLLWYFAVVGALAHALAILGWAWRTTGWIGAAALRLLPGFRRRREARARWRWALVQGRVLGWRALARAAGRKDSSVELQRIRDFGSPSRTWIREGFASPWK